MTITHLAVYRDMTISVCFLQKKSKDKRKNAKNAKENDQQEEMKASKAVNVTKHKIKEDQNLVYQLYRSEIDTTVQKRESRTNFCCQYDSKKDNEICTCKNVITIKKQMHMSYYSGMPKQIYSYHGSRSNTDVGVGTIKTLPRRKVKRIYLPETDDIGVGSSELSSFIFRKNRHPAIAAVKGSFYNHKKTSSKCVGGIIEYNTGCVINEKLSPIIHTKSGATSPKTSMESKNNETGINTVEKQFESIGIQFETETEIKEEKQEVSVKSVEISAVAIKVVRKVSEQTQKFKNSNEGDVGKKKQEVEKKADRTYSSDSLLQHVHNLENPSDEKHSKTSFQDPMENKLEREYRRMFTTTKSKDSKSSYDRPISEFKSASVLRRRFEALRRGLVKKNDSNSKKNDSVIVKTSTEHESFPSRKDVSITSDPPSLIARSISNSKKYTPAVNNVEQDNNRTIPYTSEKYGEQWPHTATESECQGVKGMFKLWGKKFNFEEENNAKNRTTPMSSYDTTKKTEKEVKVNKPELKTKKESKRFFFFKRKSKDKNKDVYKPQKDVTTGRCEISDGLTLRLGGNCTPREKISNISEEVEDITRKTWLRKFLTNTIESARSVNIRWNNSMYATSSSTVFELLDTVYKNNAEILRSRSEITTEDSFLYKSYTKHKVNFVQDIEAWMIPQTIPERLPKPIPVKINSNKEVKDRNIEVTISDQKWYIDKSEAFSHNIELVLHSSNFPKPDNDNSSSDYLRIDIPPDFFDVSSDESKRNHSSDEEVFKIVEYETNSEFKRGTKAIRDLENDHILNGINVIVSVQECNNVESHIIEKVIKEPPRQRDVVIQGSNVNIPKRCDVIGVGIMTQRDLREMTNPSLKIQDGLTDDESDEIPIPKKCEFAESYLQEYYRQWTPLGIEFPWCASDSNVKSSSEKSEISIHNQENNSKSCPNIYDDYKEAQLSCNTSSSCSHCAYKDQYAIKESCFSAKLFKRKKKESKSKTDETVCDRRVLPKDSLEVFKRRLINATSGKSQWADIFFRECNDRPVSVPSIESKGAQNLTIIGCPRDKSIMRTKKKSCKKHVSLPDCDTMNSLLNKQFETKPEGILQFKGAAAGCDACKRKGAKCSKHAVVCPKPSCEIPQPPCKTSCEMLKNPPCSKPQSPSCNITPRSITPGGTPVCPPPCFPPPSPCRTSPCPASSTPCSRTSNKTTPTAVRSFNDSDSPRRSMPQTKTPRPPSNKKRSDSPSLCSPPCKTPPPCPKPSKKKPPTPPCKNIPSPPPCAKSSPVPRKKIKSPKSSPRHKKSRSPCSKLSSPPLSKPPTPPCAKTPTPLCKTPPPPCSCATLSSPPTLKPSLCQIPSPVTRCSLPRPCPVMNPPPCPGKTCPNTPPPCKKSRSRPRCKKMLKAPPCTTNPSECCHDYASCEISNKSSLIKKTCSSYIGSIPGDALSCSTDNSLADDTCAPMKKGTASPKNFRAGSGSRTGLLIRKCPSPPANKLTKRSPCKLPPCEQIKKPKPKGTSPRGSDCQVLHQIPNEYPWPINSQTSAPPSPMKDNVSPCPPQPRNGENICSMQHLSERDSNIDCTYKKEIKETRSNESCLGDNFEEPQSCTLPHPDGPKCPSKPIYPPLPIGTNSKVSGIFLKMKPSRKKTSTEETTAWDLNEELQGVVKLSSHEKLTIRLKRRSPSTEGIRDIGEPKNIKVQDEDGATLYERKDYCPQQNRSSILGDMYRDSEINRVSAPIAVTNIAENGEKELSPCKSDRSLANSIEIQFKLRISQGDKTTEINIGNENEGKNKQKSHITKASPEVFLVNNATEKVTEDVDPKNDINIKIIVRNFKPKRKDIMDNQHNNEFSKKISDKFHTVSTGYSDVPVEPDEDHAVSIHRRTVDLCSSVERSKTKMKICNKEPSQELTQNEPNPTLSSHIIERVATDVTAYNEYNEIKSVSSKKESQSEKLATTNSNESVLPDFNDTDEQDALLIANISKESDVQKVVSKQSSKELKKSLLKKIFYRAGKTKDKDKKTVRQLREMLKIVLTDSSDNDAKNVTINELENNDKFAPTKSNYFENSDSMNNYYQLENTLSSMRNTKIATIYPDPVEQISVTSRNSDSDIKSEDSFRGCICSKVAEKLNNNQHKMNISCCCRQSIRKDEETNCDIRNAEDLFLFNYRTEYVDVETQNSKYLPSKVNSLNVSIHSKNTSFIKTTKETKVVEQLEIINRHDVKRRTMKCISPHRNNYRESEIKMLNVNTIRGDSDTYKSIVQNEKAVKITSAYKNRKKKTDNNPNHKTNHEADILQSYEAKKAVLEIYAEKAEHGEHFVAKLPKFVSEKESEITRNYKQIATNSYKSVCKENFVMSIQR